MSTSTVKIFPWYPRIHTVSFYKQRTLNPGNWSRKAKNLVKISRKRQHFPYFQTSKAEEKIILFCLGHFGLLSRHWMVLFWVTGEDTLLLIGVKPSRGHGGFSRKYRNNTTFFSLSSITSTVRMRWEKKLLLILLVIFLSFCLGNSLCLSGDTAQCLIRFYWTCYFEDL